MKGKSHLWQEILVEIDRRGENIAEDCRPLSLSMKTNFQIQILSYSLHRVQKHMWHSVLLQPDE